MKDYTTAPATMTAEELNEARKQNAEHIKELETKAAEILEQWRSLTVAERVKYTQETPAELRLMRESERVEQEKRQAEKMGAIMRNNYRVKRFAELSDNIAEILGNFEGKPYGEKTAEKMRSELFRRCQSYFYIDRAAPYSLHIIEADPDGFTRNGERFTVYLSNGLKFLSDDNKTQTPPRTFWHAEGLKPYSENPSELIKTLDEMNKKAQAMAEELRKLCHEYNSQAPEGFNRLEVPRI